MTSERSSKKDDSAAGVEYMTIKQRVKISEERRKAGSYVTSRYRYLRDHLAILRTPFGVLIDPKRLPDLRQFIDDVTRGVAAFNKEHGAKGCTLSNCMLWEPLAGVRLSAVEGWLARKMREGDTDVHDARELLTAS